MIPSSAFLPLGTHPPWGISLLIAKSSAARSAPVWAPEIIFLMINAYTFPSFDPRGGISLGTSPGVPADLALKSALTAPDCLGVGRCCLLFFKISFKAGQKKQKPMTAPAAIIRTRFGKLPTTIVSRACSKLLLSG